VKDGAVLSSKLANHPHHNAIVYLGSVSKEPSEMVALLKPCGRLVVPVLLAAVPAGDGSYSGQKIVKITLNHFREVTRDVVDGVELRLPEVM
jgi:protein-L-isoaspartate O-methyltransferase